MKLTLITVCRNSAAVIRTALESVFAQRGAEVEYIVVDGGSTDGTVEIIKEYDERFGHLAVPSPVPELRMLGPHQISFRYLSESDNGMYDAMNKGIRMSTGDGIGILNADDVLASDDVLARVAAVFEAYPDIDGTYADIRFVKDATSVVQPSAALNALRSLPTLRYCTGRFFHPWMFRFGVQTAHPSTFFRRSCFDRWGLYSLDYGMFGDFELLCRFIWKNRAKMCYLPLCTTVMRHGGASTGSLDKTRKINRTDLCALKANGCRSFMPILYLRYPFKVWGYVFKKGSR